MVLVLMNGLYFALRSGSEHCQLRHNPCQIEVVDILKDDPVFDTSQRTTQGG